MHFDDAKVLTPWGTHHQGQVMPPCNTCAQWIDNSHNVKDEYKKID